MRIISKNDKRFEVIINNKYFYVNTDTIKYLLEMYFNKIPNIELKRNSFIQELEKTKWKRSKTIDDIIEQELNKMKKEYACEVYGEDVEKEL